VKPEISTSFAKRVDMWAYLPWMSYAQMTYTFPLSAAALCGLIIISLVIVFFRREVSKEDWGLVVKLKKVFNIS
jgi:dolichyl-phosphate-mannose--protein O-mannosyl transferase